MASLAARALPLARTQSARIQTRLLSTTRVVRQEATPNLGTVPPAKKPVGAFRGGIVGFLFGFSLASSLAAYHLLEEYKLASAALQASVEELQTSTQKVSAHVRRIEAVEKDLKALSESSATKEDISRVRAEMKKLYDGLHVEFLDLRAHVWGIQEDVHALSKKNGTTPLPCPSILCATPLRRRACCTLKPRDNVYPIYPSDEPPTKPADIWRSR